MIQSTAIVAQRDCNGGQPNASVYTRRISVVIVADSRSRADLGRVAVLSDDGFLRLMREFFSETGFEPVTHLDQHGPVCFIARAHPDVVLLDILVPREKYGWATLEALREHPDTCGTPVIV